MHSPTDSCQQKPHQKKTAGERLAPHLSQLRQRCFAVACAAAAAAVVAAAVVVVAAFCVKWASASASQ